MLEEGFTLGGWARGIVCLTWGACPGERTAGEGDSAELGLMSSPYVPRYCSWAVGLRARHRADDGETP